MNRIWFIGFAILTIFIFAFAQYLIFSPMIDSFGRRLALEMENASQAQITVLNDLVRNDILAGNYREARNKLAKAVTNSRVVGCTVRSDDGSVIETLFNNDSSRKSEPSSVILPILFSKDGPKWGEAEFLVDASGILESVRNLKSSLSLALLFTIFFLVAMTAALYLLLWHSGNRLETYLSNSLLGLRQSPGHLLKKVWQPLLQRIDNVATQYRSVNLVIQKIEEEKSRAHGVTQIVHDLKSPLSALRLALPKAQFPTPDHEQLVNAAVDRIEKMIADTLSKSKGSGTGDSVAKVDLLKISKEVVLESALESDFQVFADGPDLDYISYADSATLVRILSNMIKNSVEAGAVQIRILLKQTASTNYIVVADNGRGIPGSVLSKIGHIPVTSGKGDAGTGQGLYGAVRSITAWGGTLKISSEMDQGTQAVIALPRA